MRVVETVSGTNPINPNMQPVNAPMMQVLPQQPALLTPPPLISSQPTNIQQTVPLLQVATLRSDNTLQQNISIQTPSQPQANVLTVQQQHAHQQVIQVCIFLLLFVLFNFL